MSREIAVLSYTDQGILKHFCLKHNRIFYQIKWCFGMGARCVYKPYILIQKSVTFI